VENLREKIREARNRERWTSVIFVIGLGGIIIGWEFLDSSTVLVGMILLVIGFAEGWHYNSQKNKFIRQLEKTSSTQEEKSSVLT